MSLSQNNNNQRTSTPSAGHCSAFRAHWLSNTLRWVVFALLMVGGVAGTYLSQTDAQPAHAAINNQLNFQGRLRNSSQAITPDGDYHLRFKIYSGGDGDLGGGDETLDWTETYTTGDLVRVENGYFSVQLGSLTSLSSVDFNNSTLWLSVEVGGSAGTVSWDGEMDPFIRLTSTPYAFNSDQLDGLDSEDFVQLGQGSTQAINNANTAISINQQGAGNLLQLQSSGSDVFTVSNSGNTDINGTLQVANAVTLSNYTSCSALATGVSGVVSCDTATYATSLQGAYDGSTGGTTPEIKLDSTRGALDIQDANTTLAGSLLTVRGSNASGLGTVLFNVDSSGNAIVSGTLNANGGSITSSGALSVTSGAATALTLNSGTTGAINIGAGANAKAITIGNTTGATSLTLNSGTGAINLGTGSQARTINLGTGAAAQTVNLGSNTSTSTTNIRGGTNGINIGSGGIANTIQVGNTTGAVTQSILIGTNATAGSTNNITIGSTVAGTTTLQGATSVVGRTSGSATALLINNSTSTGNILQAQDNGTAVLTIADGGGTIFRNTVDSTTGFQVLDQDGGTSVFNVDTTNERVGIGTDAPGNLLSVGALTTTDASGQFAVSTGGVSNEGIIVQGVASQSADLLQAQDSTGAVLAGIAADGSFRLRELAVAPTAATNYGRLYVKTDGKIYFKNDGGTEFDLTIGGALGAQSLTLSPEYAGATFTPDGTANLGSLSSDFCSGSARLSLNTGICATSTDEHNYYEWTTGQGTDQDYDIYIRWQAPEDFDAFSSSTAISMYGWRSGGATVELALFEDDGTQCGSTTNVSTGSSVWTSTALGGDETGCSVSAGDLLTFRVKMTAGSGEFARPGEISISYDRN